MSDTANPVALEPTGSAGQQEPGEDSPWLLAWYGLVLLLAVFTYFYGLDSDHIPKNGDEYVYLHITRITAQSGHLLPLQSELGDMRNTKPPLLFWQGILSTNWGQVWTLWRLRFGSVVYTLLTAVMLFLLGWKLARRLTTGLVAALVYLAFFSTYRYGRPFLTNPPEVFWLFVPFSVLLYRGPRAFASGFVVPAMLGLAVGIALLYKSFALLAPTGLALAWWYLLRRQYRLKEFLRADVWKLAILGTLALALFSLWFLLDPQPQAVFREFVLGENMRKFEADGPGYIAQFLWGDSSIWRLAAGYFLDAGLLAPLLVVLIFVAFRNRKQMPEHEKLLWIWVVTLFVVFSLPSQRDERYLLPGMPALALSCALNWQRMGRKTIAPALVAALAVMILLAYLSVRLEVGVSKIRVYPVAYWLIFLAAAALIVLGLALPSAGSRVIHAVVLLVFLTFAGFMRPLDTRLGIYSRETQAYVAGKDVWVPTNFRAKEEGHRFLLPGARLHSYSSYLKLTPEQLAQRYPLFAVTVPIGVQVTPGQIVGSRLDIGGRHSSQQIKEMILGKVFEILFIRELLIEAGPQDTPSPGAAPVQP